jgi:hypothetical protein
MVITSAPARAAERLAPRRGAPEGWRSAPAPRVFLPRPQQPRDDERGPGRRDCGCPPTRPGSGRGRGLRRHTPAPRAQDAGGRGAGRAGGLIHGRRAAGTARLAPPVRMLLTDLTRSPNVVEVGVTCRCSNGSSTWWSCAGPRAVRRPPATAGGVGSALRSRSSRTTRRTDAWALKSWSATTWPTANWSASPSAAGAVPAERGLRAVAAEAVAASAVAAAATGSV